MNKIWGLLLAFITILSLQSARGADMCSSIFYTSPFNVFKIDGTQPSLMQKVSAKWRRGDAVSGAEAMIRYNQLFASIFSDIHPVFLSRAKTEFGNLPPLEFGKTGQRQHNIIINSRFKNHPFYPIIHAHELSHVYDLEVGDLSSRDASPDEILDSEIRAHNRQMKAAHTLFTKEEFAQMSDAEKNEDLKVYLNLMLEQWDNPDVFIGSIILIHPEYADLLGPTSGVTLPQKASYIRARISEVLARMN